MLDHTYVVAIAQIALSVCRPTMPSDKWSSKLGRWKIRQTFGVQSKKTSISSLCVARGSLLSADLGSVSMVEDSFAVVESVRVTPDC